MPRPTPRLVACLFVAAAAFLLGADAASVACMAVATCLAAAAAWGLASVLAARWLPGVHDAWTMDSVDDSGKDAEATARQVSGARGWTGRLGTLVRFISRLALVTLRALLPRPVPVRASWERIDQHDRVVEEIPGEPDPAQRGLYRLASETLEYRDAFGLWVVREKREGGRELVVPPAMEAARSGLATERAVQRAQLAAGNALDTAMVRPYAPGDSLRGISWRQTAHHGDLMSFETMASERGRVVVAVDSMGAGNGAKDRLPGSPDRMDGRSRGDRRSGAGGRSLADGLNPADVRGSADGLAATALATAQLLVRAGAHVTLTDGTSRHRDPKSIQRFCAALWPEGSHDGNGGDVQDRACFIAQLAGDTQRDRAVGHGADGGTRARVIVISSSADSPLARALAPLVPAGRLEQVVAPPYKVSGDVLASSGARRDVSGDAPDSSGESRAVDQDGQPARSDAAIENEGIDHGNGGARRTGRAHGLTHASRSLAALVAPLLSGIASSMALALAVRLLPGLLDEGTWFSFARIALPLAGLAAPLFDLAPRRWMRIALTIAGAGALIAAGVFASASFIQQSTGAWPLGSPEEQLRAADALGIASSPQEGTLLIVVLAQGLAKLYFGQWVPLTVSIMSDAALVLTFGTVAALQLVILRARRLRPLVALLPITVLTLRYAALGLPSSTGEITASAACGLALLALVDAVAIAGSPAWLAGAAASRHSARVLPRVAIALALAALGVALSPAAVTRSQDFPVKLGLARYLSDEYAVSPLVSLKQDLTRNGTTVALTYETTSDVPLYLRMSTLDSFDGSVWLTDSTIPAQASTGLVDTLLGNAASTTGSATENVMITGAVTASTSLPLAEALAAASALRSQQVAEQSGSQDGQDGEGPDTGSGDASANQTTSANATSGSRPLNAVRPQAGATVGPAQAVYASVRIAGLATRFAPLPTGTVSAVDENAITAMQDASGEDVASNTDAGADSTAATEPSTDNASTATLASATSGDWQWSRDDLLYGTASSTRRDMRYFTTSYYLPAISSLADMNAIANLPQDLYDGYVSATDELNDLLSAHYETGQVPSEAFYTMRDPSDGYRDGRGTERYRAVPQDIPQEIRDVADAARAEGIDATGNYTTTRGYHEQYEVMRYLVGYFTDESAGWTYSLDAPDGGGSDNLQVIAEFLKTKQGYCVHYASSLALLARMLGVPSRMVTGYRANAAGKQADGSYAVTNHDLHAWVEVYLSGVGWVPFDVTPGGGSDDAAAVPEGAQAEGQAQAEQQNPRGANAGQDASQTDTESGQSQVAGTGAGSSASPLAAVAALVKAVARFARGNVPWIVAGAAVIAVVTGPRAWQAARRRWRLHIVKGGASAGASSKAKRRAIEAAWSEVCSSVENLGVYAKSSTTEHSFAEAAAHAVPNDDVREAVEALRDLVCAERYEPSGASDADLSGLPEMLGKLLAAIDGAPRPQRKGVAGLLHALKLRRPRR